MKKLKKPKCKKTQKKTQNVTTHKNLKCYKIQKLKMWQHTKPKNVTKLKKSKCDKTKKTQNVKNLKN